MGKKTGRARGRPSRLPVEQTKFLASFWASWDDARAGEDRAAISLFYNDVATQFLQKFGPPGAKALEEEASSSKAPGAVGGELPITDPTFDINTLDPTLRNVGPNNTTRSHALVTFPLSPPTSQGETTPSPSTDPPPPASESPKNDWARTRLFIVGWFNHHGKKNTKTEAQEAGRALLNAITNVTLKKPVKPGILIAYQREYYDTKIRSEFEEQWEVERTKWREALVEKTEGVEEPLRLKVRTRAAKTCWERESQEFRDEFIKTNEEQHNAVLELFDRRNEVPETPEDYAHAMETLPGVVNDIVQGLAKRFGMTASILLCGPIPTKGGTIDVLSMHSVSSIQGVKKSWPQFDPDGYQQVETKLRAYGRRVFTREQQLARALPGTILEGQDSLISMTSPSSPAPAITPLVATSDDHPVSIGEKPQSTNVDSDAATLPQRSPSESPPRGSPTGKPATSLPLKPPSQESAADPATPPLPPSSDSSTDSLAPNDVTGLSADHDSIIPPTTSDVQEETHKSPSSGSNEIPVLLSSPRDISPSTTPPTVGNTPLETQRTPSDGSNGSPATQPSIRSVTPASTPAETDGDVRSGAQVPPISSSNGSTVNRSSAANVTHTTACHPNLQQPTTSEPAPSTTLDLVELDRRSLDCLSETAHNDYKAVLEQDDWGIVWTNIVVLFATLELKNVKANLPTDTRPKQFGVWMKYGRKNPLLTTIPLDTFPAQFTQWWRALQPSERGEAGNERPTMPIPLDSWSTLMRSGRNGLYLILLGLFWWRHALEAVEGSVERSLAYKDWESIAIDILWVLSDWNTRDTSSPTPTPPQSPPSSSSSHVAEVSSKRSSQEGREASTPSPRRKRKLAGEHEESARGKRRRKQ